jgi:hypothetical protein
MECEILSLGYRTAVSEICDAGLDGYFVSWNSSVDACLPESDKL